MSEKQPELLTVYTNEDALVALREDQQRGFGVVPFEVEPAFDNFDFIAASDRGDWASLQIMQNSRVSRADQFPFVGQSHFKKVRGAIRNMLEAKFDAFIHRNQFHFASLPEGTLQRALEELSVKDVSWEKAQKTLPEIRQLIAELRKKYTYMTPFKFKSPYPQDGVSEGNKLEPINDGGIRPSRWGR